MPRLLEVRSAVSCGLDGRYGVALVGDSSPHLRVETAACLERWYTTEPLRYVQRAILKATDKHVETVRPNEEPRLNEKIESARAFVRLRVLPVLA